MYYTSTLKNSVESKIVLFFIITVGYKFILDIGFVTVLSKVDMSYPMDFNIFKYIIGIIFVMLIFVCIDHKEKLISNFAFELHLYIGIIPLSVIYAFCNESTVYFVSTCCAFILVIICFNLKSYVAVDNLIRIKDIKYIVFICFTLVVSIVFIYIIINNGLPTLTALNIYDVYELRRENSFIQNKYIGYLYQWIIYIIIPFIIAYCLVKKKVLISIILFICIFILFLYSGNKTSLFSIPLILVGYILSQRKSTNLKLFSLFSLGILFSTLIYLALGNYNFYTLFVRRVLLLPAQIKFYYYDFFSHNNYVGFENTLWGSIFGFDPQYSYGVSNTIGSIYYNSIDCNANAGFMAEGYMRFGILGIFIAFIVFAFVLYLLNMLQKKTGYTFTMTAFIYAIYSLNDRGIIDPIIFGPFLILCLICIFYNEGENDNAKILC